MGLGNDTAGDRVTDVLAGVRDQLADIASLQKKQAALRVDAQAADGAVSATTVADRYPLWIGGDRVDGSHGTYDVINPATEEVVGLAPEASADDARHAAAAAADAFPSWSQTTPEERARLLDRAADLLEQRVPELIPLVQAETGSTVQMAQIAQVPGAVVRLRRYARGALESREIPLAPAPNPGGGPSLGGGGLVNALAVRQPVGVVVCITSYNVPMTNVLGKIGPALAMGNTVVIKPAHQDPLGIIKMTEAFHDAGFPPGVGRVDAGAGRGAGGGARDRYGQLHRQHRRGSAAR
jgi:acyl-CoA reductase-like NAD-dependent aldehyde dehydrogenase